MIDQDVVVETLAFIQGCSYPCAKEELVDLAAENNAPDEVLDVLDRLPDKEYLSETVVLETIEGCP